jgi:acyl-CoA synthetase (AMP-forming)/AMP-acid ligase II
MCNIYGMTEGGPGGIYLADKYLFQKEGSVGWGKSFMGMEMIIADAEQNPVKPGEIGECLLRGASVMKEYHNDPEATKQSLRNGWFHTGDVARIDEDGFIWLMDRLKDMIVRGGYNVYPAEIETVLFGHPGVREAAVIGVPHETLGEDIKAFIVKKEDQVTADEIKEYCRKNLADFKVPRQIEFIKELPRNTAGKVLKYQLRETEKNKSQE